MLAKHFLGQVVDAVRGTLKNILLIVDALGTTRCSEEFKLGLLSAMIGELVFSKDGTLHGHFHNPSRRTEASGHWSLTVWSSG